MHQRTCVQCQTVFEAERRSARLCSDVCRRRRATDRQLARDAANPEAMKARIKASKARRRARDLHPCEQCGVNPTASTICLPCASLRGVERAKELAAQRPPKPAREPAPRVPQHVLEERWLAQRSDLRAAYEDGDAAAFFTALRKRCVETPDGCWEWTGRKSQGSRGGGSYAVVAWSGRHVQVHRASLEMKHGAPLGSQSAHHTCANASCVNPDHLQPVTHHENIAEMKARTAYVTRIRELEAALEELAPGHPLLGVIAIA